MRKGKIKKDSSFKKAMDLVFKRGNIWALAVGVLVGAAFGAVINSLANDIIMQAIAKRAGVNGVEYLSVWTTKWEQLKHVTIDAQGTEHVTYTDGKPLDGILYGKFLSVLISFFIIAFCLVIFTWIGYLIWRTLNRRKLKRLEADSKAAANTPIAPSTDELILVELQKLNENFAKGRATKAQVATAKKVVAKKAPAKKPAAKKSTKK